MSNISKDLVDRFANEGFLKVGVLEPYEVEHFSFQCLNWLKSNEKIANSTVNLIRFLRPGK